MSDSERTGDFSEQIGQCVPIVGALGRVLGTALILNAAGHFTVSLFEGEFGPESEPSSALRIPI